MLERLADLLRVEDSRGGFEANPDMLSITGMTLEQFADLMQGLGYAADRGEREKIKPVKAPEAILENTEQQDQAAQDGPATSETQSPEASDGQIESEGSPASTSQQAEKLEQQADEAPALKDAAPSDEVSDAAAEDLPDQEPAEPEIEIFYTFKWGLRPARRNGQRGADAPKANAGKKAQKRKPKSKQRTEASGPKKFQARPEKKQTIDPDNPFAEALMGLKTQD